MAKFVVVTQGQSGRTLELKDERTTIGRLDDNAFPIAEQSVSSHHCEIILRAGDVVVRDLNSTNGTFINGEQITEKVIKPGQTLRLGQIELRLENGEGGASADPKKAADATRVMTPGGVKFSSSAPGAAPAFDKNSPFTKKSNKIALIFITVGAILFALIVVLLFVALRSL